MGTVAVIGEAVRTAGFGLAGAIVFECETPDAVRQAWDALPDDVLSVIVTPAADAVLRPYAGRESSPPVVVMPS
jgi:vacuolar-type H+-ATPase subunit F/Vma7